MNNEKKSSRLLRDLTGQRFGRFVVLKRVEDHITKSGKRMVQWLCKCDCGKLFITLSANIKTGNTQSCGCFASEVSKEKMEKYKATRVLEDLTGQVINGFKVIGKTKPYKDPKYGHLHQQYICECISCGRNKIIRADTLKQDKARCILHNKKV